MELNEKKILVTGVAGFIGSNLAIQLLQEGAEVIGIDNLYNGNINNLEEAFKQKKFQFYKADVRDYDFILEITKNVDIIYHQAAFTSVPQSIKFPESCNNVNVNGTLNILNSARRNDVKRVIFASSSSVYGDLPTLPKKEDMKTLPISPYGVSKLACEGYMQVYHKIYGISTITLRYFNVFGPRQKDSPYSGVIAIWLGRIINEQDLTVFGDGQNSRDFTYIKDVINANLLATECKSPGEIFNIGAGSPIKLDDLGALMLKITKKTHLKLVHVDPRPGDIIHSFADISKAKTLLKFQPKFTQEQGLIDYFKWYTNKYNISF